MQTLNIEQDDEEFEYSYTDCSPIFEPENGIGGLYLGNRKSSEDYPFFKARKVKVILDMAGIQKKYPQDIIEYAKSLNVIDWHTYDLSAHFEECFDFINEHRTNGRSVLVHCMAGVSRSAAIVIGYIMKYHDMDLEKAFKFVRGKRSCIQPNHGFIEQLTAYQKQIEAKRKQLLEKQEEIKNKENELGNNNEGEPEQEQINS